MRVQVALLAPDSPQRAEALIRFTHAVSITTCEETEEEARFEGTASSQEAFVIALDEAEALLGGLGSVRILNVHLDTEAVVALLKEPIMVEVASEPIEVADPTATPFCMLFTGKPARDLIEDSQGCCRALSGLVTYATPPTAWNAETKTWSVSGCTFNLEAVRDAAQAAGGTLACDIAAPVVVEPVVVAPPSIPETLQVAAVKGKRAKNRR